MVANDGRDEMNDFHMNSLARDHRQELRAEADRSRRAASGTSKPAEPRMSKPHRTIRVTVAFLLGRTPA